jgi:hypothetical protein
MQIQKSHGTDDLFTSNLKSLMKKAADEGVQKEEALEENRKEMGQEAVTEPMDKQLAEVRTSPKDTPTYEKLLAEMREKKRPAAPNSSKTADALPEKRLNEASQDLYPHRNPKAYTRTGDARPINALPAELGSASDEAKRTRWEKANKPGEKRLVDKNPGEQEENKKAGATFNLRAKKVAAQLLCADYIGYRQNTTASNFSETQALDDTMSGIMEKAQTENRQLTNDEMAKIAALKDRKSTILGILKA